MGRIVDQPRDSLAVTGARLGWNRCTKGAGRRATPRGQAVATRRWWAIDGSLAISSATIVRAQPRMRAWFAGSR